MQKTEAQHKETHNPPAQRQGGGKALESPQGEQIAQLEAVIESSPQAGKMAQLASTANASPQAAAQRGLMDMIHNSPRMAAQRKALDAIHTSPHVTAQRQQLDSFTAKPAQLEETEKETLQPKVAQREEAPAKPNNTGLPDNLKSGIESLSGLSMDNVKVHYNSSQPAQLNALAYAQGNDIHVGPGQEKHLPHEAWHVVQQAQGRVQPTMQMKSGVPINDDAGLEREADVMGGRAVQMRGEESKASVPAPLGADVIQLQLGEKKKARFKKRTDKISRLIASGNIPKAYKMLTNQERWWKKYGIPFDTKLMHVENDAMDTHQVEKDAWMFRKDKGANGKCEVCLYMVDGLKSGEYNDPVLLQSFKEHEMFWKNMLACYLEEIIHWYQHNTGGSYISEDTERFKKSEAEMEAADESTNYNEVDILAYYLERGVDVEALGIPDRYKERKRYMDYKKRLRESMASDSTDKSKEGESTTKGVDSIDYL